MKKAPIKKCTQCNNIFRSRKDRDNTICVNCYDLNRRIAAGEVRRPDYKDVNTDGYKEPMTPIEGGFGYYGAVTKTNDERLIQCHICGYFFESLGAHVYKKHKMPSRDYKIKFGLRIKDGLVSPFGRLKMQKTYNEHTRKTRDEIATLVHVGQAALKKKREKEGSTRLTSWSGQVRNEKGMCREQTIAKIRHIAESTGKAPKITDFCREYGSGQVDTIKYWFGSWAAAVAAAGLVDFFQERRIKAKQEKKAAINSIRQFYKQEGRTPQWADFRAVDYLPAGPRVQHLFGTLNHARIAAGVPELLMIGGRWQEVMPDVKTEGFVPGSLSHG